MKLTLTAITVSMLALSGLALSQEARDSGPVESAVVGAVNASVDAGAVETAGDAAESVVAPDIDDSKGWLSVLLSKGGEAQWLPAAMALVVLLVGLLRRSVGSVRWLRWLKTRWGGYVLAALVSLSVHVAAPLAVGVEFGFAMLSMALIDFLAAGKLFDMNKARKAAKA